MLILAFGLLASIKSCGTSSDRASIVSLDSTPTTPVAGENVTTTVKYTFAGEAITGGKARYKATLNYLPVLNDEYDLCTQTKCPKNPGENTEVSTSPFPPSISGKLVTTIHWIDQNSNPIWCVETTWKV
jgi:hypothetical protein